MIVSSRGSDQFPLRLPDGMRDKLKGLAARNGRSTNSEIVIALFAHLAATEGLIGVESSAAASSNNATLAGGAFINR